MLKSTTGIAVSVSAGSGAAETPIHMAPEPVSSSLAASAVLPCTGLLLLSHSFYGNSR